MKKILVALLLVVSLVGCEDNSSYSEGHLQLVEAYEDLEKGHNIVKYSGNDFLDLIEEEQAQVVFIGAPT